MSLIHDDLLDRLPAVAEGSAETLDREVVVQRLGADRGAVSLPLILA
jgi:hypothetical protein